MTQLQVDFPGLKRFCQGSASMRVVMVMITAKDVWSADYSKARKGDRSADVYQIVSLLNS